MFDMERNSEILLYGYSLKGMVSGKKEKLLHWGSRVLGYLDQNAKKLRNSGIENIWTIEEVLLKLPEIKREKIIIILLLQNGQIHEAVANSLYEVGFEKILYLPLDTNDIEEQEMCRKYNLFLEDDFDSLINIPSGYEMHNKGIMSVSSKKMVTKYITKIIPIKDIYSYQIGTVKEQWIGSPNAYYDLWNYVSGNSSHYGNYFQIFGTGDSGNEKLLEDRRGLYYKFEKEWLKKTEYFKYAAPHARWNENGYFNVIDGHHRITYLVFKGEKRVYLRVPRTDYEQWKLREREDLLS